MYLAKTKVLISHALICDLIFANAKSRFSHEAALIITNVACNQ